MSPFKVLRHEVVFNALIVRLAGLSKRVGTHTNGRSNEAVCYDIAADNQTCTGRQQ
jgi:hypothetical protein